MVQEKNDKQWRTSLYNIKEQEKRHMVQEKEITNIKEHLNTTSKNKKKDIWYKKKK